MVAVVTVAEVVVVLVGKKVLVRAEAVINILVEELVIGVRVDVSAPMDIIVAFVMDNIVEFAVTVPDSVNALADVIIEFVSGIAVGV